MKQNAVIEDWLYFKTVPKCMD